MRSQAACRKKSVRGRGGANEAVAPLITAVRGWLLYLIRKNRGDTVGLPVEKEPPAPFPVTEPGRKDSRKGQKAKEEISIRLYENASSFRAGR